MEIKTKFNITDKVWFISRPGIHQGEIKEIHTHVVYNYEADKIFQDISYTIVSDLFYCAPESAVFSSEEEAEICLKKIVERKSEL